MAESRSFISSRCAVVTFCLLFTGLAIWLKVRQREQLSRKLQTGGDPKTFFEVTSLYLFDLMCEYIKQRAYSQQGMQVNIRALEGEGDHAIRHALLTNSYNTYTYSFKANPFPFDGYALVDNPQHPDSQLWISLGALEHIDWRSWPTAGHPDTVLRSPFCRLMVCRSPPRHSRQMHRGRARGEGSDLGQIKSSCENIES